MRRPLPWLLLLALALRLIGIAARPIWYDEAFAILFARTGLLPMIHGTLAPDALGSAADIHPLGYYTLLWGWLSLWGQAVPAARWLSVLVGLGVVWIGFQLAKSLFGERVAFWAGILLAVSPFQIHYSQEIRMYGLLALLLCGATYAFLRAIGVIEGEPRWRHWIAFTLCAALAQYTHTLAAFYLLPLAYIPVLRRDGRAALHTLAAGLGTLVLYSPWLAQLPGQFAKVQASYWTAAPGADRLVTTLLAFVANLPIPNVWLLPALLAALLLTVFAGWQSFRAWRRGLPGAGAGLWLAYLAFAPPVLMFAFSQWVPVYIERALLPSGVMFLLWAGWAIFGTGMPVVIRTGLLALVFSVMALGIYEHVNYDQFPYAPTAELNDWFEAHLTPGDVVIHSNKLSMLPAYLDSPNLPLRYIADPPGSGSDTLARPTQEVIGLIAADDAAAAVGDAPRVWLVIFAQAIAEYGDALHAHLLWLNENYTPVSRQTWGDLIVYEYIR